MNKRHISIARSLGATKAHWIAAQLKGDERTTYQARITLDAIDTTARALLTDAAYAELDDAARQYMHAVLTGDGFTERTGSWTHPNLPGMSV